MFSLPTCFFYDCDFSLFQMDFGSKYVYKYDLSEDESLSEDEDERGGQMLDLVSNRDVIEGSVLP